MEVLVDTCIWSQALRRPNNSLPHPAVAELTALINESRAKIIGPIE